MSLHLITYDLKAPGRDYDDLYALLKDTWRAQRVAESVWVADLRGPAPVIRDFIRSVVDQNDRIVVIALGRNFDWATVHAMPGLEIIEMFSPGQD